MTKLLCCLPMKVNHVMVANVYVANMSFNTICENKILAKNFQIYSILIDKKLFPTLRSFFFNSGPVIAITLKCHISLNVYGQPDSVLGHVNLHLHICVLCVCKQWIPHPDHTLSQTVTNTVRPV